jgi:3-hydroxybutyryl-CoA dehydrogenase
MTKTGVAGAGVMGTGVAQSLAMAGHDVTLVDVAQDTLDRARARIYRDCRLSRLTGGPEVNVDQVMNKIATTTDLHRLNDIEVLVENITEDWQAKLELYQAVDVICPAGCIFIVNTSAIPITRVAALTGRADKVIGVHFMNPVPMKGSVELIPGHHTSEATSYATRELLRSMGKKAIQVADSCGFVSNRILMPVINEAAFLVYERVASPATVDAVHRECFGHPMGPLETADLIGVDTILLSIEVLYDHFADSKYRPCPLLRHMVAAGQLGRKAGQGFYAYDGSGHATPVQDLVAAGPGTADSPNGRH